MKKIGLLIIGVWFLGACEKELSTYHGVNGIGFEKSLLKDSIVYSFAFHPDVEIGEIAIPVEVMGPMTDYDREYRYEIDSRSTAREGIDYQKLSLVGRVTSKQVKDTIRIKVIKNIDMLSRAYSIFIRLVPAEDFVIGIDDRNFVKVYVSDILTKPTWWDDWYIDNVMGAYSDKKYRYLIEITGESDLEALELYKMRSTVLKLRYHIEEILAKAELETDPVKKAKMLEEITDENGIMNIPLRGALPDRDEEEWY